jgi:hypothetical protein
MMHQTGVAEKYSLHWNCQMRRRIIMKPRLMIRFERLRGMHIIIISLGFNIKLGL